MRNSSCWSFLVWGALAFGAGCGSSASSTGSNSNWLVRCNEDADCGMQGVCWCGACTKSCGADALCRDGTCHASDELGCATPSGPSVCVAECAQSADCPDDAAGVECVNGACLPAASAGSGGFAGNGTGGLGAGGSSQGGSGAGGSGVGGNGSGSGGGTAGGAPVGGLLEPGGATLGVSASHTCYVWSAGSQSYLDCWGGNLYGQSTALLPGVVSQEVDRPRRVVYVTDPVAVAVSDEHSCALTAGGEVYCWGLNDRDQVGGPNAPEETCPDYALERAGYYACQPEPQRIEGIANAVRIAVATGRSCALLADGTLRCWGAVEDVAGWIAGVVDGASVAVGNRGVCVTNRSHELSCSFPLPEVDAFPALERVALTGSGAPVDFACALGTDQAVRCFGDDALGGLGTGGAVDPPPVSNVMNDATAVAVGAAHACALGGDGKVRCWGRNTYGALGTPPRTSPPCGGDYCEPGPLEVTGLPPIRDLGAGGDRTCAVGDERTVWCWGQGSESTMVERIGGQWETGSSECEVVLFELTTARREAVSLTDRTCVTDQDCVNVSVDLSCSRSCIPQATARSAAPALEDGIAQLEAEYCANAAVCSTPDVACPTSSSRPVCVFGVCSQEDPEHSGCDDACGCAAVVSASATGEWKDECSGFNLWPMLGAACGACTDSTSAIVVGNRGDARFSGEATLTFEHIGGAGDPPVLPDPVTVALDLEPGAVSNAIHVLSTGQGGLTVRVTAPGDCNSLDDASAYADFPSPSNPCD